MKLTSDIFNEEYDLTITNPPFGKECLFSPSILNNKVPKKIASELFIVANGSNNSKISTFLCPESMLANNNFHSFRKKALEDNTLLASISFSEDIFYGSVKVKTSALLFERGRTKGDDYSIFMAMAHDDKKDNSNLINEVVNSYGKYIAEDK